MQMLIGLVGEKLAGKDTVANYLVDKYGAYHVRFTHLLDKILNILELPISRRNEIDLGLGLRKIFGKSVLGSAVLGRALKAGQKFAVINGIRMDEMQDIKNAGATIIYITAPANMRFERYQKRREKTDDGIMNFEDFKKQELEATEIDIPKLGAKADFKINNVASFADLRNLVDKIIQQIYQSK